MLFSMDRGALRNNGEKESIRPAQPPNLSRMHGTRVEECPLPRGNHPAFFNTSIERGLYSRL